MSELNFALLYVDPKDARDCLPRQVRVWDKALTEEQLYRVGVKYYLLRNGQAHPPPHTNARRLDAGLSRVCKEYAAKFGALPAELLTENLFLTARQSWARSTTPVWLLDLTAMLAGSAWLSEGQDAFSLRELYETCLNRAVHSDDLSEASSKLFTKYGNALRSILGVTYQEAWRILLEDVVQLDGISLYD